MTKAGEPIAENLLWPRERVLHGIELDQATRIRYRIRLQGAQFGTNIAVEPAIEFGVHEDFPVRYSAERACAVSPSPYAKAAAVRDKRAAPAGEQLIMLLRFWKSYTPSGDEKRAVLDVGRTWLGPAQ